MHVLHAVILTSCAASVIAGSEPRGTPEKLSSETGDFENGDPRRCLGLEKKNGYYVQRFEVLPGYGWDNLRNVDQGQVVRFNFSKCRTTDDGRFLLPDSISAVPIKTSEVETSAELISHYKDWTSTDSKSINVDTGLSVKNVDISGKFSADFQNLKSKQIGDKSVTTRAQARYVRYAVHLQPDTSLDPVFRGRLLDIAAAHELNETDQARYLSQLLVRDFGTHVVTKVRAGAALIKMDHVEEDWVKSKLDHKKDILVSASLSLFSVFSLSSSFRYQNSDSFSDEYTKHMTSSRVETKGGPLYKPGNYTPNEWAEAVDGELVAVDRSGDPLYYTVTRAALPELPLSTLQEVATSVKQAVETYYAFNVVPGCLDRGSPNFSPAANVEDGSCNPPHSNLTFGGVYQTCSMSSSANGDLCGSMTVVNPLTGGFSCPPQYKPVRLLNGNMRSSRSEHRCKWFLFIKYGCHDNYYESRSTYELYWCAAGGPVPQNTGYLFGGLYTSQLPNPVTRSPSCPQSFFRLSVGSNRDLHVCISDDYEFSRERAVPFAGFSSCNAGNPLAMQPSRSSYQNKAKLNGPIPFYRDYFVGNPSTWPQQCPKGFSKHLAAIDKGCQINYCVQTGAMAGPSIPRVNRPPFTSPPPLYAPPSDNMVVFDAETRTWNKNAAAASYMPMYRVADSSGPEQDSYHVEIGLTAGEIAGVAVGAVAAVAIVVVVSALVVKKKRRRHGTYHPIEGSLPFGEGDGRGYGAASTSGSINTEVGNL